MTTQPDYGFGSPDDSGLGGDGGSSVTIWGSIHDEWLTGGDGSQVVWGFAGNDTMTGEAGDDAMDGGLGDDLIYGDARSGETAADGDDDISGGDGDDRLYGGGGDDTLTGGADDDTLLGGSGSDRLSGGTGDDLLVASAGDDTLSGGAGDDLILAGPGNFEARGNGGSDQFRLDGDAFFWGAADYQASIVGSDGLQALDGDNEVTLVFHGGATGFAEVLAALTAEAYLGSQGDPFVYAAEETGEIWFSKRGVVEIEIGGSTLTLSEIDRIHVEVWP